MVSDLSQDGWRLQLMEQGDGGANGLDRVSLPEALGGVVVRPIAELAQLVQILRQFIQTNGLEFHRGSTMHVGRRVLDIEQVACDEKCGVVGPRHGASVTGFISLQRQAVRQLCECVGTKGWHR
jgi:hypothetical protein